MQDWQDIGLARETFETLCRTLDKKEWRYQKEDEKLTLFCGAKGDDLPIDIHFTLDPERMLIVMVSHLPFVTPEDKRLDTAIAVSAVNNLLAHGCFDFDLKSGHMFFRMSNSFIESRIGEELFAYLLMAACNVVDEYNDKFLMLGKGNLSLQQFLEELP